MPFANATLSPVRNAGFPEGLMRLEYVSGADSARDEALVLPSHDDRWIVCIHGFGGKCTQLFMRTDIKRAWLPCYLERGLGILSPTLRGNSWMRPESVRDMDDMLDLLRAEYGARRFYFCSGSLGATSNLIYACLRPDNVSGVVAHAAVGEMTTYHRFCVEHAAAQPMLRDVADSIRDAFGGLPHEQPEMYKTHSPIYAADALRMPIVLLHGDADELMPVEQARYLAQTLSANPRFTYIELPGADHNGAIGIPDGMPGIPDSPLARILGE